MSFSNKSFCVFYDENNDVKSINNGPGYIPSYEDIESLKKWCDNIIYNKKDYIDYTNKFNSKLKEDYKSENYIVNNTPKEKIQKLGYIYLIYDNDNNALKIGFSKNPKARLQQLQIATKNKLYLLYTIEEKTHSDEKWLHEKFKRLRLKSEWFSYNKLIIKYFEDNGRRC